MALNPNTPRNRFLRLWFIAFSFVMDRNVDVSEEHHRPDGSFEIGVGRAQARVTSRHR
jgi:hypothetical protein